MLILKTEGELSDHKMPKSDVTPHTIIKILPEPTACKIKWKTPIPFGDHIYQVMELHFIKVFFANVNRSILQFHC
jgi:hypothetical protein